MSKQSLGQNFLMHPQTAERIVHTARLPQDRTILEIGPGTGMLTRALLAEGHAVVAVEADGELVEELARTFADEVGKKKLVLVHEDIRKFDTVALPKKYSLVANIPYYLTGEIIRTFLSAKHKPQSMTLLVQKEVAERITGRGAKRTKEKPKESLLSLSVQAYGTPEFAFVVPRGAFRPAPKVDSAIISIRNIRQHAFADEIEEHSFFAILKAGFAHKRKLLAGNLSLHFPPEKVARAFKESGLSSKARSEDLALADWRLLATHLR
ncbi:MAG: rRNA (adenine1518-N6/adenine1519-N6)-dimethyltransferase [Candidatus Parcubacteria bacterium]|jgi:16S rRNA (adenine1518-N6/adenine1519-N6)-dimethyltransferase|nr:rRNA (adenine1518-N6/adenine1519-N6)-dimethyltransferase [Candidatus Parcubacteria bacterium]